LTTKVVKNQFAVSAIIVCVRILFLFTYAKIEYVCVYERIFQKIEYIRYIRILEPWSHRPSVLALGYILYLFAAFNQVRFLDKCCIFYRVMKVKVVTHCDVV